VSETVVQTKVGRLRVSVTGHGNRPTALLWHSLFVDELSWERVIPELALDRRLVVVTGPGHGRSGDPGHRYSMEDCAEAAVELLEAVGVEGPVDWVGNAWGGHVGIIFAARHPDRVRTLVTAGTPVHPYALAGKLRTAALLVLYRWFGPTRRIARLVIEALLSERVRAGDPAATDLVQDSFVHADRKGMTNAVVSISLKRRDLTPVLADVNAPTLFVTGSEHPDWSPEQMGAAAALLPTGSSRVVDGAAYLVPLEAPDEFSRCVREFWKLCAASAGAQVSVQHPPALEREQGSSATGRPAGWARGEEDG
jgi:pimeloyl-ACP methyl ester carboxylesterase